VSHIPADSYAVYEILEIGKGLNRVADRGVSLQLAIKSRRVSPDAHAPSLFVCVH